MNNPCVSWPLNSRLTFGGGNPETSRESSSCHSDLAKDSNPPRFKAHIIYYEIHCCMNYHQKHIRCVKHTVKLKKACEQMVFQLYFTSNINFPDILCLHHDIAPYQPIRWGHLLNWHLWYAFGSVGYSCHAPPVKWWVGGTKKQAATDRKNVIPFGQLTWLAGKPPWFNRRCIF